MIKRLEFNDIIKSIEVKTSNVSVSYVNKGINVSNDILNFNVKEKRFYLKYDYKTINYEKLLNKHIKYLIKSTKKEIIYFEDNFIEDSKIFKEHLSYMISFTRSDDVLIVIDEKFETYIDYSYQNLEIYTYPNLDNNVLFFPDYKEETYKGYKLFYNNDLCMMKEIQPIEYKILHFTNLREEREKKLNRILKYKKL